MDEGSGRYCILISPIVDNVSVIGTCLVYIIRVAWIGKGVTIGVLFAFIGYIWRFWMPVVTFGNFYNQIVTAVAYLERIFETMDEKLLVEDIQGAIQMPPIKGAVEFKDVGFSYDTGLKILDGVNFSVKSGDTIALVGPTGAGKTTVINLISRFYNIEKGKY